MLLYIYATPGRVVVMTLFPTICVWIAEDKLNLVIKMMCSHSVTDSCPYLLKKKQQKNNQLVWSTGSRQVKLFWWLLMLK